MCALLDTLAPGQPVPVDPPVGVSGLSHRSVLDVLRRLEPWLESGPGGYRLRAAVEGHATAEIDLQDLRMARLRLVLATDGNQE